MSKNIHPFMTISEISSATELAFSKLLSSTRELSGRYFVNLKLLNKNLKWFFIAKLGFFCGHGSSYFLISRKMTLIALQNIIHMRGLYNISSNVLFDYNGNWS